MSYYNTKTKEFYNGVVAPFQITHTNIEPHPSFFDDLKTNPNSRLYFDEQFKCWDLTENWLNVTIYNIHSREKHIIETVCFPHDFNKDDYTKSKPNTIQFDDFVNGKFVFNRKRFVDTYINIFKQKCKKFKLDETEKLADFHDFLKNLQMDDYLILCADTELNRILNILKN
jgi:hypothetical protein